MKTAPGLLEEASEIPDTDTGVPICPAADAALVIGSATLCIRGLPPVNDVVRTWLGGGIMKRSATDEGGDRGKDVRIGRLPGELARESLC